jgi:8-oxo-dGTP pyrophosphatase MutT (NUDIX family)
VSDVTPDVPGTLTPAFSHRDSEPGYEAEVSPWEVLKTEYLLRTPWRSVRSDWIRIHTGDEVRYDYLDAPDASFVVPLTVDGKVAVLRQYRHPVRAWIWEVVGGGVGPEGPRETALRELREEIGGRCRELVALGSYLMGAGAMNVRSHLYLALDVELGEAEREPMELVEVVLLDPEDAFARARDGRIDESQSALALLRAEPLIRAHLAGRVR